MEYDFAHSTANSLLLTVKEMLKEVIRYALKHSLFGNAALVLGS